MAPRHTDKQTPHEKQSPLDANLGITLNIPFFSSSLREVFFTVDLLAGQPAGWTTIEVITLLIIYLPGRGALLRQLIKSVKDL